jgi:predicted phosphodiesterase
VNHQSLIVGLGTLVLAGCLNVAEERAEQDLRVGHASREGNRVDVEDGLAAVRRFEPGRLELWANAPTLRVQLSVGDPAPAEWEVRVRNVMPDAVLTAEDANGTELVSTATDAAFTTERRVTLPVTPGTVVSIHVAAPDADQPTPFTFIDFADVQTAIDRVQDIFQKMNAESAARFVVMCGDVTQNGRVDQLERFQAEQGGLRLPIFTTLGNHELGDSDVPFHDFFGRGSESFAFHGAHFTLLDSGSATLDPMVYGWLDGWLANAKGNAHFVFMHIPPIEPIGIRDGAFSSRAEADKLIVRLARGRVTGTFYGHVHSYYAFDNAGIPAFISGGGGAIPERFDGIGRHFLVVDVDPDQRAMSSRVVRVDD